MPEQDKSWKNIVPVPVHITSGIFQILEKEYRNNITKLDDINENEIVDLNNLNEEINKLEKMESQLAQNWIYLKEVVNVLQTEKEILRVDKSIFVMQKYSGSLVKKMMTWLFVRL